MSVCRVEKTNDYTVMSNTHLKDKRLSLKAIGLLSKVLSLPDDWDYSKAGLCAICKEGISTIDSIMSELKEFGYLEIEKLTPNKTKSGRIEYIYTFFEISKQEGKKQGVEKQGVEILDLENRTQLNTNTLNTKELNTNNKKSVADVIKTAPKELQEPLNDYVEMRKEMKSKPTPKAMTLLISKINTLSKGDVEKAKQIIEQSTMNGWKGVFPLRESKRQGVSDIDWDNI